MMLRLISFSELMFLRIVKLPCSSAMQSYEGPMKSNEEATVSKMLKEQGFSPPSASSKL
jgi:hypothetical protein